MTLQALLNRPVTLVKRSASGDTDEFGGEIRTETLVETFGELQQQRREEPQGADETSDTRWLLILPAGTDIQTDDGVVVDGQVYELTGSPWRARNPRTMVESHVEATCRRVSDAEDGS